MTFSEPAVWLRRTARAEPRASLGSVLHSGVVGAFLLLFGGLVISVIPTPSVMAQLPIVAQLRSNVDGRMFGLCVTVAGLGLLARAWISLGRRLLADPTDGMVWVQRAAIYWSAPLLIAPPLFSRDAWSYAAQGALTHLGLSPYSFGPNVLGSSATLGVAPRWLSTPAPYGPVAISFGSVAASFTHDPYVLIMMQRIFMLVGLVLLSYSVPRLARLCGTDPVRASWLVLPSPLVLTHGVGGIHNDLLMVGLMAAGIALAAEGRWLWGAALIGTAAAVKWPALVGCLGIAALMWPPADGSEHTRWTRIKALAAAGSVAVATLLAWGVVTGLGIGWLHAAGIPGLSWSPLSMSTELGTFSRMLLNASDEHGLAAVALPVFHTLGAAIALGVCVWIALRTERRSAVWATGIALVAVVLLGPIVHHWYALWCLPMVATARNDRLMTTAIVTISMILSVAAPLDSSLPQSGIPIMAAVAVVAVVVLALLGRLPWLLPPREPVPEQQLVDAA